MPIRCIARADGRRARWLNGGGWTREIVRGRFPVEAVIEEGAAADGQDWDWRLSVAEIDDDGAFSTFAGIDRILVLLEGAGMRLDFAEGETVSVTPTQPQIAFAGERMLDCHLLAGPTRDFNLMWRRDRADARLRRCAIEGGGYVPAPGNGAVLALYLRDGSLTVDGLAPPLVEGDCLLAEPDVAGVEVSGRADLLMIDLLPRRSPDAT